MDSRFALIRVSLLIVGLASCTGCQVWDMFRYDLGETSVATPEKRRKYQLPPPADLQPYVIPYQDTTSFDSMLDEALLNRRSFIVIQTNAYSPSQLRGRVNEWVAAWKEGGPVHNPHEKGVSEVILHGMRILNSEEFHKFMNDVGGYVDVMATWYKNHNVRRQRAEMLQPYILAFNPDPQRPIQIMLYNGNYNNQLPTYFDNPYAHQSSVPTEGSFSQGTNSQGTNLQGHNLQGHNLQARGGPSASLQQGPQQAPPNAYSGLPVSSPPGNGPAINGGPSGPTGTPIGYQTPNLGAAPMGVPGAVGGTMPGAPH